MTVAHSKLCKPLPDEIDDCTAAAIANPGMSSWAALTERAKLQPGALKTPWVRFSAASAFGAVIWCNVYSGLGYVFSGRMSALNALLKFSSRWSCPAFAR